MTQRRFSLAVSSDQVFPGGELDKVRLYHEDVIIETNDSGVHVIVPDTIDTDTTEDLIFHLQEVHGFKEIA